MEKIKQFLESDKGKDILIVVIIILVGLGSFELGRLSKENDKEGLKIEYKDQNNNTQVSDVGRLNSGRPASGKNFFASNKGSKYYSVSCSSGKTIKEENKVYFKTGEEAERAGYALSSACN